MQEVVEVSRALENSIASLVSCFFRPFVLCPFHKMAQHFMAVNQYSTSP